MTRIVAGAAGGRALRVPPRGTRPTSDRVREALFSRLDHAGLLDGAHVLDLYAGSGALGLEAASRGATDVVLVESARTAAEVCRRNLAALGLPGVRVVAEKVLPYLRRTPPRGQVDVALLDPPYDLPEEDLAEALAALVPHLAEGATVVVERDARTPEPAWPSGLERIADRRYGETVLWFAGAEAAPDAPAATSGSPGPAAAASVVSGTADGPTVTP
ncbi:16S rRNA (guanine(966)-N(2))-methyltransferase RsmD [Actinotalea sp. Marseille-Q4924]|uniref:16S rRNA (guanine(966)-N(2))-methyltransferase RsmD n=1 Tax=Actinotalea sp. Marseille-Q4924 TaxID=2866571 RepID=UPI001CE45F4B|nr:16S rRNA (guanine(966)-N(2))-methyltransferase RsmD [Actinotalea sp. Marseille-Q4924]